MRTGILPKYSVVTHECLCQHQRGRPAETASRAYELDE